MNLCFQKPHINKSLICSSSILRLTKIIEKSYRELTWGNQEIYSHIDIKYKLQFFYMDKIWDVINQFDLDKIKDVEQLQIFMNTVYGFQADENRNPKLYLKLTQLEQLIIFYLEYTNLSLNEIKQSQQNDIKQLDILINKQEDKLLQNKHKYQKSQDQKKKLISFLKHNRRKPEYNFGCINCELIFNDILDLDKHMLIHKQPESFQGLLMMYNQLLQQQVGILAQAKEFKRQMYIRELDFKRGMEATAEYNAVLNQDVEVQKLEQTYDRIIHDLKLVREKFKNYEVTKYDNIEELEQVVTLLDKQINAIGQSKPRRFRRQKTIEADVIESSLSRLESGNFIGSSVKPRPKIQNSTLNIIIDEDDQSQRQQTEQSEQKQMITIQSPQNVSINLDNKKPAETFNDQSLSIQEYRQEKLKELQKIEEKERKLNRETLLILKKRFYGFIEDPSTEEREKINDKLDQEIENMTLEEIEQKVKEIKIDTKGFSTNFRSKINLQTQPTQQSQGVTTEQSEGEDDIIVPLKNQDIADVTKVPFNVIKEKLEEDSSDDEELEGYGVNAFSINY
ncbi:hypothetical protein pb186bvf_016310 [Paramecium bursaria]